MDPQMHDDLHELLCDDDNRLMSDVGELVGKRKSDRARGK